MKGQEEGHNWICPQLFYVLSKDCLQTTISASYMKGEYTQKGVDMTGIDDRGEAFENKFA